MLIQKIQNCCSIISTTSLHMISIYNSSMNMVTLPHHGSFPEIISPILVEHFPILFDTLQGQLYKNAFILIVASYILGIKDQYV